MVKLYSRVTLLALSLAFVVVVLGAFTRLSDAGLGCPDWPGCYGQLTVPQTTEALQKAAKAYPSLVVEKNKAWPEMIHRYFAGSLGSLIFVLAFWALLRKRTVREQPILLPLCLVGLVIFQAVLGMWTVTWKLLPLVVMGHLLGGMSILALLWWLFLQQSAEKNVLHHHPRVYGAACVGLIILALQIFLGGWTSSNYAAIICPDFPFCHGALFPHMDIAQGFNFASPIGANYQGGTLTAAARTAIQMFHRYGAFVTAFYLGFLSLYLVSSKATRLLRSTGWVIFILLIAQIGLGILNVAWQLPISIAVAHNAIAAALLLAVIALVHKAYA